MCHTEITYWACNHVHSIKKVDCGLQYGPSSGHLVSSEGKKIYLEEACSECQEWYLNIWDAGWRNDYGVRCAWVQGGRVRFGVWSLLACESERFQELLPWSWLDVINWMRSPHVIMWKGRFWSFDMSGCVTWIVWSSSIPTLISYGGLHVSFVVSQ